MFGIWMVWDEVKPCLPGLTEHEPSIGKWHRAGAAWATDNGVTAVFECEVGAAAKAAESWHARRHAHPPFVLITPRRFPPAAPIERMSCNGPDLSALSGWWGAT